MNATAGPYAPGGRDDALAFTVSVIVTPFVSVTPKVELAVSQDGDLIEYLTVPVDALTRYLISDGENGPPFGPEKTMLVGGVTINAGGDCTVGVSAAAICVDNSTSKAIEASRPIAMTVNMNVGTSRAGCRFLRYDTSKQVHLLLKAIVSWYEGANFRCRYKIFGDIFFLAFGISTVWPLEDFPAHDAEQTFDPGIEHARS